MRLFKRLRKRKMPPNAKIKPAPKHLRDDDADHLQRIATWTDKQGQRQRAILHNDGKHVLIREDSWSFVLRMADGSRKTKRLARDKSTAEKIARKLQDEQDEYRHGTRDKRKDDLGAWMTKTTIVQHLRDFERSLDAKQRTEGHITDIRSAILRIADQCGFEYSADINAAAVEGYKRDLSKIRSARTVNRHIGYLKSFCAWLVQHQRMDRDPITGVVATLNTRKDRKRVRRALTDDEARRLIRAAENGAAYNRWMGGSSISGADRAMLYRLALGTGFRASELRSLTPESFDLGSDPTVTVKAAYSKHRRDDIQPIHDDLAKQLKKWMKGKAKGEPVFIMPDRTNDMLRLDLQAAEIDEHDDAGRVIDFHALRHTFISRLARSGIAPALAKDLARHSSIVLTMDSYTHMTVSEQRAALDKLPDLDAPDEDAQAQPLKIA